MGDCGLTGRKIIVDTYGGHGAHGGGAFSEKTLQSRPFNCMLLDKLPWLSVVQGLADRALVQVAYAIGVAEPVSFLVDTFGTEKSQLIRLTEW